MGLQISELLGLLACMSSLFSQRLLGWRELPAVRVLG